MSLRELLEVHAGGGREPGGLAAVAIGGPMGSVLAPAEWDLVLDYVELRRRGVRLGHGGIVAIPASANLVDVLSTSIGFMAAESCGKCVPCAMGSRQALGLADRLRRQQFADPRTAQDLVHLMKTVEAASLCGFGQGIAGPVIALAQLAIRQAAQPGQSK